MKLPSAGDKPLLDLSLKLVIDWCKNNQIRKVQQQGFRVRYYVLGTVAIIEGWHYLLKEKKASLSEQELVDYVFLDFEEKIYAKGCQGNSMAGASKYIIQFGISFKKQYPYIVMEGLYRMEQIPKQYRYKNFTGFIPHPPNIISYLKAVNKRPLITGIYLKKLSKTGRKSFFL